MQIQRFVKAPDSSGAFFVLPALPKQQSKQQSKQQIRENLSRFLCFCPSYSALGLKAG